MSEERFEIEESFAEMLEKSIKTLNTGDTVSLSMSHLLRSRLIWVPSTLATSSRKNILTILPSSWKM